MSFAISAIILYGALAAPLFLILFIVAMMDAHARRRQ